MATDPANDIKLQKERAAQLNKINMLGQEFNSIMKDASINMKQQLKDAGATQAEINDMVKGFGSFNQLARQAAKLSKADLSNRKTRNKLQSAANKAADEAIQIEAKIEKYRSRAEALESKASKAKGKQKGQLLEQAKINRSLVSSGERQLDIAQDLQENMQGMLDLSKKITKAGRFFSFFSDLVGDVPVLGTVFNNLTKAAELFDASMAAGESRIKATLRGLGEFIKLGAKALAAFAVSSAIKGMNILDQTVVSINRNLVMTGKTASIALGNIRSAAAATGMTLEKLLPINTALNEKFGSSVVFSKETLTAQSLLVNKLGLSQDAAAKLFKLTVGTAKSAKDFAINTANNVINFNKTKGLALNIKTVLNDIGSATNLTAINTAKFPGGIQRAALEARRLGTSLDKTTSMMEGFLDFEQSIAKEQAAEVITGRQLNLEGVRRAALLGDTAKLAEEIRKEAGTLGEFQALNTLQQRDYAAAFNMTASELADVLKNQKVSGELAKENAKEGGEQAKSGEELINKLQSQVTLGESFASAMERIQLAFGEIIVKFAPDIKDFMTYSAGKAEEFLGYIKSEDGKAMLVKIKDTFKTIGDKIKDVIDFLGESTLGVENWKIALGAVVALKFTPLLTGLGLVKSAITGLAGSFAKDGLLGKQFTSGGLFSKTGSIAKAFGKEGPLMRGLGNFAKSAKGALGKGMESIGSAFSTGKDFVSKGLQNLNPVTGLKESIKKAGGMGKFIGKIAKFPAIATALEGAFAYNDIQSLIGSGLSGKELDSAIGERAYSAIGTVLGTLGGSILGSAFPGIGTMIGGFIGSLGGGPAARALASTFDPDYSKFGGVVSEMPFFRDGIDADDFTIRTNPADTITMAGGTKLGGNVEALLEELISITKEGKVIKMDAAAVGRSLNMNSSKMGY